MCLSWANYAASGRTASRSRADVDRDVAQVWTKACFDQHHCRPEPLTRDDRRSGESVKSSLPTALLAATAALLLSAPMVQGNARHGVATQTASPAAVIPAGTTTTATA